MSSFFKNAPEDASLYDYAKLWYADLAGTTRALLTCNTLFFYYQLTSLTNTHSCAYFLTLRTAPWKIFTSAFSFCINSLHALFFLKFLCTIKLVSHWFTFIEGCSSKIPRQKWYWPFVSLSCVWKNFGKFTLPFNGLLRHLVSTSLPD